MNRYMNSFVLGTAMVVGMLFISLHSERVMAANEIVRLVPFQGRLHGSNDGVVPDGVYDLTFYVYDTPTGGTALWTENHSQVSVIHGYVNVLLGAIEPMDESNYATQEPFYGEEKTRVSFSEKKYLGISINGGAEMFPRSQLVPSFHAYTANHANHSTHSDTSDLAADANKLGAIDASDYALESYVDQATSDLNLDIANKFTGNFANESINSQKLGGQNPGYYGKQSDVSSLSSRASTVEGKFTGSKAKDADKLDGLDSSLFLRSNGKAVDSDKLDGLDNSFFRNASNLNAGTISKSRLPSDTRVTTGLSTNICLLYTSPSPRD